jgi:hypothetical protein
VQASFPGLRLAGGAAFAVEVEGEERLVVVQEVERMHLRSFDTAGAIKAIRKAVIDEFGINVHEIVFIRPATLPKTSSGKTQRQLSRQRFMAQALDALKVDDAVA